jgi:serine phosphatase RsbU (regulator of sigma subunit)
MTILLKNKSVRFGLIIAGIFFVLFSVLTIIKNLKSTDHQNNNEDSFIFSDRADTISYPDPIPANWKYHSGDDKQWAQKDFNDSLWIFMSPKLNLDSLPKNMFNGICWFRFKFSVDSSLLNKLLSINFEHFGASEIYLDGKFLMRFGKPSPNKIKEKARIPDLSVLFSIRDLENHTIAIRYSNQNYLLYKEKFGKLYAGIKDISFKAATEYFFRNKNSIEYLWNASVLLFGFFTTLGFVHLLLYLFYRKQIQNLYYSIFVFLFAILIISSYILYHVHTPLIYMRIQHYNIIPLIFFLPSILLCLHSLFKPKFSKRLIAIGFLIAFLILIFNYIESLSDLNGTMFFILIFYISIESVRTVVWAIMRKLPGAKIIGTGVLTFFLFVTSLLFKAFINGNSNFSIGGSSSLPIVILIILCVISIPLSMSIYLARNFALTNNSLELKLAEVSDLSAKSIEQEKEKQNILANQNIILEKQVKERTSEITEQKKIIEEKNKDIIDSINYAKRIQSAMLPDESAFQAIFNNSFVLYMPRDIVSGDFYYAAEINGNKLIIAADCTGHGVPGALMSMVGCNIINKLVHENKIADPKIVLETLHTQLRQALKQDQKGSVNRDGMDIAAVLISAENIVFASANRPLIYFDDKNEMQELKATKTPVGGSHIESINLEQHVLETKNVKQLYLFSDGFADQFGGPSGKKLMVSKFKLWLKQIYNSETKEQHAFLQGHFTEWKQESEQVDDVMVIGIKIT